MRILIAGAGALGSFYGALLARSGNDVALLAQGERLCYLRKNGLRYRLGEQESSIGVRILDKLKPEDRYDYIFVTVGREELPAALEALEENCSPTLVLVCSGLESWRGWEELAERGRAFSLIPGVEAELEEGVAKGRIFPAWFQPTAFGEWNGADTFRVRKLKKLFRKAKLPCRTVPDPGSWQVRRLSLLLPLAEACGDGTEKQKRQRFREAAACLRANLNRLRERGLSLSRKERLLERLPEGILAWGIKVFFRLTRAGRFLSRWAGQNREEIHRMNRELAEYRSADTIHKE